MSIAYKAENTRMRFYVPKTLESDFDEFLNTDIPGAVMDFEHLHNWYDKSSNTYRKKTIRGEIYPDSTKSRYANTDNNLNFRASRSSDIESGDMIIDPDGIIYLLDWEVPPEPNNKMSRALRCNAKFEFKRWQEEKVNSRGIVTEEAQWKTIADEIPCNVYRYDGRPEFSAISFTPGVVPNALTMISVQLNDSTAHLAVDDQFTWANEDYVIIDVSYAATDIYSNRGILKLQAKKKAGGMNQYLLGASTAMLSHSNAFADTPMNLSTYTGEYGSIYVPASKLTTYQAYTTWAYYSERFVGLTDEEIADLQGDE